jgi:hypothetical protein
MRPRHTPSGVLPNDSVQTLARLLARGLLRLACELPGPMKNTPKSPESALSSAQSALLSSGKRASLSTVVNTPES